MKCLKCGFENVSNAKFCAKCGAPQNISQNSSKDQGLNPKVTSNQGYYNHGQSFYGQNQPHSDQGQQFNKQQNSLAYNARDEKNDYNRSVNSIEQNKNHKNRKLIFILGGILAAFLLIVIVAVILFMSIFMSKRDNQNLSDPEFAEVESQTGDDLLSEDDSLETDEIEDTIVETIKEISIADENANLIEIADQGDLQEIEGPIFNTEQWYVMGTAGASILEQIRVSIDNEYVNLEEISNKRKLKGMYRLLATQYEHCFIYDNYNVQNQFFDAFVSKTDIDQISKNIFGQPLENYNDEDMVVNDDGIYFNSCGGDDVMCLFPYKYSQCEGAIITECCLGMSVDICSGFDTKCYSLIWAEDQNSEFGYRLAAIKQLPYTKVVNHVDNVKASSELIPSSSDKNTYKAKHVIDGNMKTAWNEGAKGNGINESITLTFDEPQKIHGLVIAPGYAKSHEVYSNNNVPTYIRIDLSNGESMEVNLNRGDNLYSANVGNTIVTSTSVDVYMGNENVNFEDASSGVSIFFSDEYITDFMKITILDVQSGVRYSDACISEIYPF